MAATLAAESAQNPAAWVELEALLRTLDKSSNRLDSLDSIRDAVKANGCLPDAPLRTRLLSAASSCASDPNSRIASKWLQVCPPPPCQTICEGIVPCIGVIYMRVSFCKQLTDCCTLLSSLSLRSLSLYVCVFSNRAWICVFH